MCEIHHKTYVSIAAPNYLSDLLPTLSLFSNSFLFWGKSSENEVGKGIRLEEETLWGI